MEGASVDNPQEVSEKRRTGSASWWRLPRLILIGDGFTDSECADRIVEAVEASCGYASVEACEPNLWVHLRDRTASAGLFRECAARLAGRLRNASPSILLSVNGRPEVADALQCGYHAGVRDAPPGFLCGPRQPFGVSTHNEDEARNALAKGAQYLLFSPVFNPQGKPGYVGSGIDALRDFVQYIEGRLPVYALGGVTPERVGPCLDAGSYGVAVLSGIMMAGRPGKVASVYLNALRAYFEDAS